MKRHPDNPIVNFQAPEAILTKLQEQARENRHSLHEEITSRLHDTLGKEEKMGDVFQRFLSEFNLILKNLH